MSNDVQVMFGANIAGAVAGIEKLKDELGGVAEIVKGLQSTLKEFGELIGVIFAVDQVKDFVEAVSDMGGKIESASSQLGETADQILAMKYAAGIADTSLDQATKTIDRFYMSAQQAQSGTSRQAAAFAALGINVKEFLASGHSLPDLLDLTTQKLGGFADSANKSTIIMDLFGNRSAQTVRLVNTLSDGMGKLTEVSQKLDPPNQKNLETLNEMHVRITDLSTVTDNWKMGMAEIGVLAVRMAEGFVEFLSIVATVFDGLSILLVAGGQEIKDFAVGANDVLGAVAHGNWNEMKTAAGVAFGSMKSDAQTAGTAIQDLVTKEKALIDELENPALKGIGTKTDGPPAPLPDPGGGEDQMKQWEDQLKQQLLQLGLFYEDATRYEVSYWEKKKALATVGSAEYNEIIAKLYDLNKQEASQNLSEYKSGIEQQQAAAGDDIEKKIALQEQLMAYLKAYYAGDVTAYNEALQKKNQLTQQEVEKEKQTWTQFFSSIGQSFNSAITGMLKGTSTWRQSMGTIVLGFFNDFMRYLESHYVTPFLTAEAMKVQAAITGNAATTASDQAAATASSVATKAHATGTITTDAAMTYGGVFANLSPLLGPAAAGPAAASQASVLAQLSGIASFDVGSWSVPQDGLAMIHQGEMIIPANQADGIRGGSALGSGGDTYNVNISAVDAQSFSNLVKSNPGAIVQIVKQQARNFNPALSGR